MKNMLWLAALTTVTFVSCEKNDDDNEQSEKSKQLTQQSWKFESAGFDLGSNGSVDLNITSQLPTCLTDNTLTFTAGGSGTADEGATKCNASDPQTNPFTWSFANNETAININGNVVAGVQNGGQFRINTLSSTQLVLAKDTVYQGVSGALIATFKH